MDRDNTHDSENRKFISQSYPYTEENSTVNTDDQTTQFQLSQNNNQVQQGSGLYPHFYQNTPQQYHPQGQAMPPQGYQMHPQQPQYPQP
mmetsp:Transcript_18945/g.16347  ORF Transcript_18945/g.16347 Transcript_18945/m.16347 type:complete len:89 (-) Transcript_18945:674-940(-)